MAFGAKIKLSVDTSGASDFQKKIQSFVNVVTVKNPIKLKNLSIDNSKQERDRLFSDLQKLLSSDTALTLKIGKIDANNAIKNLRQQLKTMLSGLSITGLKEFLGESDVEKIAKGIDNARQSSAQWAAQLQVVDDIQKRLSSTYKTALSGNQMLGDAKQVRNITDAYTNWQTKVEQLRNSRAALSKEEIDSLQQEGVAIQQKINQIQREQLAAKKASEESTKQVSVEWSAQLKAIDDIQKKLSSTYQSALSGKSMIGNPEQISEITSAYTNWLTKIEQLKASKVALSKAEIEGLQQEGVAIQQKISLIQREQVASRKAATENEAAIKKQIALENQQVSLKNQVQRYITSNTKVYKVYADRLDDILKSLSSGVALSEEEIKRLRNQLYQVQSSAKAAGISGNTFFDTMKKGFAKFGGWSLITRTLVSAYGVIGDMITAVKELDAAMTELRKVTDLSEKSYRDYLNTARLLSQQIGSTLSDTVNATADFARLGYSITDSTALAEAALVYKNVGDGITDIGVASESLISTIKAFEQFGESADNAMSIVDRFNEVGNKFAISSEGIGAALQRSASSLAAAGNNLNESIALITGMNAVVQDSEKVGTVLKTVSMYLRAAKTEAEDAGESTDGMASSVSKLRKELLTLTKGKVDIMIDDTTFKSTYQIMKELSKVWNELSDIDTANILNLIGGKRNANAVTSLLQNFDDAEKALQTAASASGSALAENEKYIDSIAGKLSVLQAQFESFSTNLIDSGAVKFVLDLGSGLLSVLDTLTQANLLLPTIGLSLIAISKLIDANKISDITDRIKAQSASIEKERILSESLKTTIDGLNKKQEISLAIQLQKAKDQDKISEECYKQVAAYLGLIVTEEGLATADGTLIVANKGLATSFKTLMASIPVWGWISLGISVVLELATLFYDLSGSVETSTEKIKRLDDEFEQLNSTVSNTASQYRQLKSSSDEIIPRFTELAAGVNEFGENVSLSDEEYEEFLSLNNQIAEMFPELDLGFDSNGNHILALSYSVDTLTESLEALVEAEKKATNENISNKMEEAFKNIANGEEAYQNEINKVEEQIRWVKQVYEELLNLNSGDYTYIHGGNRNREALDFLGVDYSEIRRNGNTEFKVVADVDFDKENIKRRYIDVISGLNREIEADNTKISSRYSNLNSIVGYWLQTTDDYELATDEVQQLLSKVVGNIDYSQIIPDNSIETSDALKTYISDNIITSITSAEPEVQNALSGLFDLKSAFENGDITVGEYGITDYIIQALESAGLSDDVMSSILGSINFDEFKAQFDSITAKISGADDEVLKFVSSLDSNEFNLVYSILQESGSMSIYELQEKIDELKFQSAQMVNPLDMTEFVSGLDQTANAVDKVTSAMAKLSEGTALSKQELMELVNQYPQLLEQANLFADEGVEGQKDALNSILDMYEQQYDAQIDAKIAELTATKQALDDQLTLETDKANLIQDIKNLEVNGKITQEQEFETKLSELNDLQGKNYVKLKEGELQVNEEALNQHLSNESSFAEEATENIWEPYGESIVSSHVKGYNESLNATNSYSIKLRDRLKTYVSNLWSAVSNTIKDLFSGQFSASKVLSYFSNVSGTGVGDINTKDIKVNYGGEKTTINGQDLDEWINNQEQASEQRIKAIEDFQKKTTNAISNLEKLKGLDLTSIYTTPKDDKKKDKTSTKKKVEEYKAEIDALREYTYKLEEARKKTESLEEDLSYAKTTKEKISILNKLKKAYKSEYDAEKTVYDKKQGLIKDNIKTLKSLGFEVEYNTKTNSFYVKNLEHVNEINAKTKGQYDSLQEATNAKRESILDLIETTISLNGENIEAVSILKKLQNELYNVDEQVKKLKEDEYKVQSDPLYKYNKAIKQAEKIVQNLEEAVSNTDDPDAKVALYKKLADAYKVEYEAEQDAMKKRKSMIRKYIEELQAVGVEVEYTSATNDLYIKNLTAINKIEGKTSEETEELRKKYEDLADTIEDLNEQNIDAVHTRRSLVFEIQNIAEAIIDCIDEVRQKQVDAYNDIIQKRKEAMQSAKDEYDYEEDIADKVKEIAELQAKIDKLSLDNSREAQAQRAALIEELQEKQKDLNKTQSDHAYESQSEALDKMADKYEEEKNKEFEILKSNIGAVQDLGTALDTRLTNAWNNATKAVEAYAKAVAGLQNISTSIAVQSIPKYHSGGVVGGNSPTKQEVVALLETGEIVLNDKEQQSIYRIIDFQSELADRLGVQLGKSALQNPTIASSQKLVEHTPTVVNTSSQTVFSPEFNVEITHNGDMSDTDARKYGEEIASTAIDKLYEAFNRKGMGSKNGSKLKP